MEHLDFSRAKQNLKLGLPRRDNGTITHIPLTLANCVWSNKSKLSMGTPRKNGIDHGKARSDVGPDSDGVDLWIPLLDPGVHDQIFAELKPLLCFNQRRKRMWAKLATFLLLPASSDSFEYAYLGGGFLSRKPEPEDIDVVLQTLLPYGPEAFEAISTFFVTGLAEIREVYGVHLHFWMENAPAGLVDFRAFFQYSRSKKDSMHLDPSKGVARINLRNGKNLENIRLISESEN